MRERMTFYFFFFCFARSDEHVFLVSDCHDTAFSHACSALIYHFSAKIRVPESMAISRRVLDPKYMNASLPSVTCLTEKDIEGSHWERAWPAKHAGPRGWSWSQRVARDFSIKA